MRDQGLMGLKGQRRETSMQKMGIRWGGGGGGGGFAGKSKAWAQKGLCHLLVLLLQILLLLLFTH